MDISNLDIHRPESLGRLLRSLEAADYDFYEDNPSWDLVLEIHIDGGGEEKGDRVRRLSRDFKWSHGDKVGNNSPLRRRHQTRLMRELAKRLHDSGVVSWLLVGRDFRLKNSALATRFPVESSHNNTSLHFNSYSIMGNFMRITGRKYFTSVW